MNPLRLLRPILPLIALCAPLASHGAPVFRWDFGNEESTRLEPHGGVHRDVPGPRAPEFPEFEASNTAAKFDGKGAYFSFADPGPNSPLDFTNGDALTLEAWVHLTEIGTGENVAVIGKGRTGNPAFAGDNQNWALRLREKNGVACINFLFATARQAEPAVRDAHWHRWTSDEGFKVHSGWHHIAVTYRFGEPSRIQGWLDGRPLKGSWDMGGETTEAPVVDDDAVWIGSTHKGAAGNSFRGSLDAISIHREVLAPEVLAKRYQRTGEPVAAKPAPEVMPDLGPIPPGKVRITLHQNFPATARWLNEGESEPEETLRWDTDHFLLPRLPLLYDAWGIRDAWKGPVLARLGADVEFPAGSVSLLARVKNLTRLWINGTLVTRHPLPSEKKEAKRDPDGEEAVAPVPVPAIPGVRPPDYEMAEVFIQQIPVAGKCRVVLETLVGSPKSRCETGELTLAFRTPEGAYAVLGAAGGVQPVPLSDSAFEPVLRRLHEALAAFDTENRRRAATSQDAFWEKRHAAARLWAQAHPAPTVPPGAPHPVDAFLQAKIRTALEASSKTSPEEALHFHTKIHSILRDECFRCHGDKDKGGLKLNSRESALQAGESGSPAVVPGNPDASVLLRRIRSTDEEERMPPKGSGLPPEQIALLEKWIQSGAPWPSPPVTRADVEAPPVLGDAAFLRKVWLDLAGAPPREEDLQRFLSDSRADKRVREIDRLLAAPSWADTWMPYWLDVLAENPTLINPTLNTTGPFRWFLLEALRDNKPFDRFVTELVMMRGNPHTGGSAGFSISGENDAPFATKGQILASAFLAIELQCARCHDSPYHSTKQADLFGIAAMLERKAVTVPKTSMVPAAFFEKKARESLIKASLKPGQKVEPSWAFLGATGIKEAPGLEELVHAPGDTRARLAALLTAPDNTRFAQVLVNRTWRRFMGAGFVEPVADWEGRRASHPELMEWLAHDFVAHGYDLKHLVRRILTSDLYQREATGANLAASPELRFFHAPERRRLSAEQVVDALFAATGQTMNVEELTFDPTGRRAEGGRISLGRPTRAWMFANLTNDRDRPSLSMPYAQCVVDVLEAFGWNGARQAPRTDRETAPNVLQPGVLANGALSTTLTRASLRSPLAEMALQASSPEELVQRVFRRFLSRNPGGAEAAPFALALAQGFPQRVLPPEKVQTVPSPAPLPRLTWFNHLHPDSSKIALEIDQRAHQGPPPDPRLEPLWRERFEDFVWSILNTREFVWLP
jgi:hypothetical protein